MLTKTVIEKVKNYMTSKGYKIFIEPDTYNIVYIEGMNTDGSLNDDKPNHFNDLRIVFNEGITEVLGLWTATTEPGSKYTYNPMNRGGAARIQFGQYKAWQIGYHGSGNNRHEALVQTAPITVCRDFNKDFTRTNDKLETGLFGVNQHHGWDLPLNNIQGASAGCLVGRTTQGHKEFMKLVKQDARYVANNKYEFWTTIIPGDKLDL